MIRAKIKFPNSPTWLPVFPRTKKTTLFRDTEHARAYLDRRAGRNEARGIIYNASIPYSPNMPEFPWGDESIITIQY